MGNTDANENGGATIASTIAAGRQTEVALLAGGCFGGSRTFCVMCPA